jgi:hypothetical protein
MITENTTIREFLQLLGTECLRNNLHPDIHVISTFSDYKTVYTTVSDKGRFEREDLDIKPNWIITDTRFPNEAEAIKSRGGIVIRVDRKEAAGEGAIQKTVNGKTFWVKSHGHASETSLDEYPFDYVINNNGTIEELVDKVQEMLNQFNIK